MIGGLKRRIRRFVRGEKGALLVFFAMCCAAIFLIAALSFDLGKRASTQSELQSFADNVALAAAGELDGMPGALDRAQTAADQLIRDRVTFGEGNRLLAGAGDFNLSFYASLPTNEAAWSTELDASLSGNDVLARFARVEVNPVQVEWSFARILNVFSSAPLPSEDVAAEATAGYSAMACDVTPVFFCMPPAESGVDTDGIWDPANHIGDTLKLVTTSGDIANWGPGSMGFFDIDGATDTASRCFGESGADLYNCLMTVSSRRSQCVENGTLALQDGEVPGITHRYFNVRMDRYIRGYRYLIRDPAFPAAPIVTKPWAAGSTCGGLGGIPITDATDFLPDDNMSFCPDNRCGDGDWTAARMLYVDINYSVDDLTIGTIEAAERITVLGAEYHIDDPFRPGDATNPRRAEYADYPVVPAGAMRWNYYNAEIAAAYFDEPAAAYLGDTVDLSGASSALRNDPIDLLEVLRPDGTIVARQGSSLPQCARNTTIEPRRRAFVAAAVDCNAQPINGPAIGRATWFVELFILDVADGGNVNGDLSFHVEVISPGLQNAGQSLTNGTFRNLAQLFR